MGFEVQPTRLGSTRWYARIAAPVLDRIRIVTLQGYVEEVDLRTVGARMVKMTAIPQMVALFNGVGGGAAGEAAQAHHVAVELQRLEVHEGQAITIRITNDVFFYFVLG